MIYSLTDGESGQSFQVDFQNPPSSDDVDAAVSYYRQQRSAPVQPAQSSPYSFTQPTSESADSTTSDESEPSLTRTVAGTVARNVAPLAAATVAQKVAGPITRAVGARVGASAGALVGAVIPGLDVTGVSEGAGAIIGGILGYLAPGMISFGLAKSAQTKAADELAPESELGSKEEAAEEQAHPVVSTLSQLAMLGKPNPMNLVRGARTIASAEGRNALIGLFKAGKDDEALSTWNKTTSPELQKQVGNVLNIAQAGGLNAAFNAADQIESGHFSFSQLMSAAAQGTLFNSPWIHARNPETDSFEAAKPKTESEDQNATGLQQEQEGVQSERGGGNAGGKTPTTGIGDSLLNKAPGEETPPSLEAVTSPLAQVKINPGNIEPAKQARIAVTGARLLMKRGVEADVANRFSSWFVKTTGATEIGEKFRSDLNDAFDKSGLLDDSANTYSPEAKLRLNADASGLSEQDIQDGIQKRAARAQEIAAFNQQRINEITGAPPKMQSVTTSVAVPRQQPPAIPPETPRQETPGSPATEKIPGLVALEKKHGFTYDGEFRVGDKALWQFTFRNLPKTDAAYGATFYTPENSTPETIEDLATKKSAAFREAAIPKQKEIFRPQPPKPPVTPLAPVPPVKPIAPTEEALWQTAGYRNEKAFQTDFKKNRLAEYNENEDEFAKRRFCSGTVPKGSKGAQAYLKIRAE